MVKLLNRCCQLRINNQMYPGFLDFRGIYDGLSQSGLITFSGSINLLEVENNPKSLDTRKPENYHNFCFGEVVELLVENDDGIFKKPRCLPKLFIKSVTPFNPMTLQSTISVVDVLGIVSDYTTDHWENPEDEDSENWWDIWNVKGEVSNSSIISKILTKLNIRFSGGVQGRIRTPWKLSGGLIQAAGNLAFNSDNPGYLWSDYNGSVRFSEISVNPQLDLEIWCDPVEFGRGSTTEPISQLVVTAAVPQIEEQDPDVEEEDETGYCTVDREFAPEYTFNPAATGIGAGSDALIATERTCTNILQNSKVITTIKDERRGIVFPDLDPTNPFIVSPGGREDFIRSFEKTVTQEFDATDGQLIRETTRIRKPWGLIFNGWYDKHQNWNCAGGIYPSIATPSAFPDEAKYHDALHLFQEIVKTYTYNGNKKTKSITTTTTQPVLSMLTDYNGTLGQGAYLNFAEYAIASQSIERWHKSGKDELHTKIERRPAQFTNQTALKNREDYLYNIYVTGDNTVNIIVNTFKRFPPPQTGYENRTETIPVNFVSDKERLALISTESVLEASRTGAANAPATEYLPNLDESDNSLNNENWIDKPIVYRLNWDYNCPDSQYKPPRELLSLNKVYNKAQLKKIADIIFAIRQGESQTYELSIELDDFWINRFNKPVIRTDIKDCCYGIWSSHYGQSIAIAISRTQSIVQLGLLWIGSRSIQPGVDADTGYLTNGDDKPIYPGMNILADPITGYPLNGSGEPYHPELNLPIDPDSGFPTDGVNLIDPISQLTIDRETGLLTDGVNLIDPATNLVIDPTTGYPTDGLNLIDPSTGWVLDSEFYPIDPTTGISEDRIATLPVPVKPLNPKTTTLDYAFTLKYTDRWKLSKIDRLYLDKYSLLSLMF